MKELIEAAKSVIEARVYTGVHREQLRAAVERAEKPPAGFDEWWSRNSKYCTTPHLTHDCWTTAQQAERERIRDIIKAVGVQGNSDDWFNACDTILERIDESHSN